MTLARVVSVVVLASVLTSCSGPGDDAGPPPPAARTTAASAPGSPRADEWRADLEALVAEVADLHPDLAGGSPARLSDAAERLASRAGNLDDDRLMVGVMRLARRIPANGRDGHTGLFVWGDDNRPVHSLPLRVWFFDDGLYVEDQLGGSDLVGTRIVSIGGHRLADVLARLDPLVPRDNQATLLALRPRFLLVPEVLHGLGLVQGLGEVVLGVVGRDGRERTVHVSPVPMDRYNAWAGPYGLALVPRPGLLRRADQVLWHRRMGRVLYVSYDSVQRLDDEELDAVGRLARSPSVDRIVVDVRQNLGGEVGEETPLVDILTDPRVARPGRLYVLTGRNTFSAAALFTATVQRRAPITVVGEPMGGAPSSYGNSEPVRMEHSGLVVSVATTREGPNSPDPRKTIAPDIVVGFSSSDYFAGRDPVLERALHGRFGR
jgi:hypothetical protein